MGITCYLGYWVMLFQLAYGAVMTGDLASEVRYIFPEFEDFRS